MTTYSKSFTGVGEGPEMSLKKGDSINYSVSGTFAQTFQLQRAFNKRWETVVSGTAAASGTIKAERDSRYRFVCSAYTSGTMVTSIVDQTPAVAMRRIIPAAVGKAGTTAGWVTAAANNLSLATCPASQTASTLVVPVMGLRVGDVITGFYAVGQIESAGNTATFDVSLRKMTAAAADVSDAAVASATQLSVTADTIISSSNTRVGELVEAVDADESFYFLITATTALATDIALQAMVVELNG